MKTTTFKAEISATETWVIKRPRYFVRSRCSYCEREVSFLIPEEAARLVCLDLKVFDELIEQGSFHVRYFGLTPEPFICLNSLCAV